jgi:hypothetical protein
MKSRMWRLAAVGAAALVFGLGAERLWAQGSRRAPARVGLLRPGQSAQAQTPQQKAKKVAAAAVQTGLFMILEYDPALSRDLDLDDNGDFLDNGDRALRQGDVWLSNRNGARLRIIGRFATEYQYLDVSGEDEGTDLNQITDLYFFNDGQVRVSGFWNVNDGNGDAAALHVDGTTGVQGLRRYQNGQFFFLDGLNDDEELWFLGR